MSERGRSRFGGRQAEFVCDDELRNKGVSVVDQMIVLLSEESDSEE